MFYLLLISYGTLFILGLIDNSRGAWYPQILENFSIGPAVGSWIFTIASLAALVATLSSKIWPSHISILSIKRLFLFIQFVGCLMFGLAGMVPYPFVFLMMGSMFIGASFGGLGIILNILVSKTPVHVRKRAISGLHATYGAASLLAPLGVVMSGYLNISWPVFFVSLSVLPLFLIGGTYVIKDVAPVSIKISKGNRRNRLLLGFFGAFYVSSELAISTRLVYYVTELKETYVMAPEYFLVLFFGGLLLGRAIFSFFNFKARSESILRWSLIVTLISFILGLQLHPIFLALNGFTMSIFFPCLIDWISSEISKDRVDNVISYIMIMIGASLIVMNWMIGAIAESSSITTALYLVIPCLAICLILLAFLSGEKGEKRWETM